MITTSTSTIRAYYRPEMPAYAATRSGVNDTYTLVSTVGYLLGVPKAHFDNEYSNLDSGVFAQLEQNKNARILRNLCVIRTDIERNYREILNSFKYELLTNLHKLPQYVTQESIEALRRDGVEIIRTNHTVQKYIMDLNRLIQQNVGNCKAIFPEWINWEYIRQLFLMPEGDTDNGIKKAANVYYQHRNDCPYGVYMNWSWSSRELGNILYNDEKFARLLYESHGKCFTDLSKVKDVGDRASSDIYDFLEQSQKVVILVDCENSDPYKLYAVLNNLQMHRQLDKIGKIILCDDVHTSSAWGILNRFTSIPVEHMVVERIKEGKSLVDHRLVAMTCQEVYKNGADSVILFASDSDYWGMISVLSDASFLVMVESGKCGPDIKNALSVAGIPYAYIDDFCTGNATQLKYSAVQHELRQRLDKVVQINLNRILDECICDTRAELSATERKQLYDRYLKNLHVRIAENGDATLELGA